MVQDNRPETLRGDRRDKDDNDDDSGTLPTRRRIDWGRR